MTDVRELRLVLMVPDFDAALRFYRVRLDTPGGPQLALFTPGE